MWEVQALEAWRMVRTQLRLGAMGGVLGLDYAGCRAALEPSGLWEPEVIAGLQVIEGRLVEWAAHQGDNRNQRRRGLLEG
jgi:hypothetical protein